MSRRAPMPHHTAVRHAVGEQHRPSRPLSAHIPGGSPAERLPSPDHLGRTDGQREVVRKTAGHSVAQSDTVDGWMAYNREA